MSWQRWLCASVAVGMAVATPIIFGVSIWTIFLTAIFLACPAAVAWAYFETEREIRSLPRRPSAATLDSREP